MTNNLNERKNYGIIIAAVVSALVIMAAGMTVGLIYAVREHESRDPSREMSQYLLEESAYSLKSSMSALRLCDGDEPAEKLSRTALVHAVRAETALECRADDWADSRQKEAFLNDVATILHSYPASRAVELADDLYGFASSFYDSVVEGKPFEYNGELIPGDKHDDVEVTDEDRQAARALVEKALGAAEVAHIGDWDGHIEFSAVRGSSTGYALVCGKKIIEFSFMRESGGETVSPDAAQKLALKAATACGYPDLSVEWSERVGSSVAVIMCKSYGGALACDDCATAVVYGDKVVAFSAGSCEKKHSNIPSVKKTESEAHRALKGEAGKGELVVRTVDGRERVCYRYRFDLEDGVHYVYVCAESGKQMEVV